MAKFKKVIVANFEIPIDPEEERVVIKAKMSGDIAILKQGVFDPKYFKGIVLDIERNRGWDRKIGPERFVPTSNTPLTDEFAELRENIKQLAQGKEFKKIS